LTDVDNTLYDFVDFYGTSFRGMLHVLSKQLRTNEVELLNQFKEIFQKTGTLDYQFLIQHLKSAQHLSGDELNTLIRHGRIGFDKAKRKRLVPYPGIAEVLRMLDGGGVRIIGITNAPYYHVIRRLQDIGLFQFFSGLIAWEGERPPPDDEKANSRYAIVRGSAARTLSIFEVFPKELSKPNPFSFSLLKGRIDRNARVFALGDSVSKDLAPSAVLNTRTIWARYGTKVDAKNLKTILEITPWSEADIKQHGSSAEFTPDYVIDSPNELLAIVPHWKSDLFQ
jgi:phosphoglycolate phosphatase-like HAD superfamily hydrolase